jgi:hypothetical protein
MSIFWSTSVTSGSFTDPTNWTKGVVPGVNDVAELITSGGFLNAIVSSGSLVTVLGTNIVGAGAELIIDTPFTATEGTATGANQGTVQVNSGGQFNFGGTFNNPGNVDVASGGTATVERFDTTLKGGGAFGMDSDSVLNVPAFITLTNVDNLIGANGTIQGAGTLINQSKGRIDGLELNGTGKIELAVKNTGLLEATNSFALDITSSVDNTGGGTIRSADSIFGFPASTVLIDGADILGGTLITSDTSAIVFENGATLDGTGAHPVTLVDGSANPTLQGVSVSGSLHLEGTINVSGGVIVAGAGNSLVVQSGGTAATVTLRGKGGFIVLRDGGGIEGGGAPVTLVNVNNTITGDGAIGGAGMKLNNGSAGVIDANSDPVIPVPLVIDTGANTITNAGAMKAESSSTLFIASNLSNTGTLVASGGLIETEGTVTGGNAVISGAGSIDFAAASSAKTTFAAGATGQLLLESSSKYSGTIFGFGGTPTQTIDLADFDFSGVTKTFASGVLTLTNSVHQTVHLHFSGSYTLASFTLSDDGNFNGTADGTLITDPPVASKPQTKIFSLFASYIASSFVSAIDGHGAIPSWAESPMPLLSLPHR